MCLSGSFIKESTFCFLFVWIIDICFLKCCRWLYCSSCSGFGCLWWEEAAQRTRTEEAEAVGGIQVALLRARLLLLGGLTETTRTAPITHQVIHLQALHLPITILVGKLRRILRGSTHGLVITTAPLMRFESNKLGFCEFFLFWFWFWINRLLLLFHMLVWSPRIWLLVLMSPRATSGQVREVVISMFKSMF